MITKKTIKVPLYPCKLEIIIYDEPNEVEILRDRRRTDVGFCDYNNSWITMGVQSNVGVSVITHESHHAKNSIWSFIGYTPQNDNDEVDAYLIGWIAKQVTDLYYKHKDKFNEKESKTK